MGQSTAYSSNYTYSTECQTACAHYVINVSLVVLQYDRYPDKFPKQPNHHYEQQHQKPVGHQGFKYDRPHLSAAFIAEFGQNLKCASAACVGIVCRIGQVGQDSGRCRYNQYDLGKLVVPRFFLEMQRKHHQYNVYGTDIHYTVKVTPEGTPVIPNEYGMANKESGIDNNQIPYHYHEWRSHDWVGSAVRHFKFPVLAFVRILCLRSSQYSCRPQLRILCQSLQAFPICHGKGCPDCSGQCPP